MHPEQAPKRYSLQGRLARRLGILFLGSVMLITLGLFVSALGTFTVFGEATLLQDARRLAEVMKQEPAAIERVAETLRASGVHFAVEIEPGTPVLMSSMPDAVWLCALPVGAVLPTYFRGAAPNGVEQVGLITRLDGLWIRIAEPSQSSEAFVEMVFHEYLLDYLWVIVAFAAVMMVVGQITISRAFQSVRAISQQAMAIEPPAANVRLSSNDVPSELWPTIAALNGALDRLERGFIMQREFLAHAAHQLRTPLAALGARVDDLQAGSAEAAAAVRGDVRRLSRLVNQLLKVARFDLDAIDTQRRADLHEIAEEAVAMLAPVAVNRGRSLALIRANRPVMVRGNAAAIGDALTNLIENALEHSPPGGEVEVEVAADGAVRVLDRGPGMPAEFHEHPFQRFWRGSDSRYAGAGLGLSIVSEVARQHGANVTVEQRPGGGTIIGIRFPRWLGSQRNVGAPGNSDGQPEGQPGT